MHEAASAEELDQLRYAISDFLRRERHAGGFSPRCDAWMQSFDRSFSRKLAEHGWLGITWPVVYGGGGKSHLARLVVTEELLRAGAPVAAHWISERQIGPAILRYGTDSLKEEFLPPIAAGELTFCLGMSESEAGSDLAAVRTTARRDKDGFRVSGAKIWTTNAHHAEFAYVLACTDLEAPKEARLSELVLDMHAPGIEVRPIVDLAGAHHFNEVFFDDVFVPDRWVIGTVGRGWEQVTAQLAFERGGSERFLSTFPLLQALVETAAAGESDLVTQELIGELVSRLRALRTLAWDVALRMDSGDAPTTAAAILKFLGTRFEHDVLEAARWLHTGEASVPLDQAIIDEAQLAMPGISLRGGQPRSSRASSRNVRGTCEHRGNPVPAMRDRRRVHRASSARLGAPGGWSDRGGVLEPVHRAGLGSGGPTRGPRRTRRRCRTAGRARRCLRPAPAPDPAGRNRPRALGGCRGWA